MEQQNLRHRENRGCVDAGHRDIGRPRYRRFTTCRRRLRHRGATGSIGRLVVKRAAGAGHAARHSSGTSAARAELRDGRSERGGCYSWGERLDGRGHIGQWLANLCFEVPPYAAFFDAIEDYVELRGIEIDMLSNSSPSLRLAVDGEGRLPVRTNPCVTPRPRRRPFLAAAVLRDRDVAARAVGRCRRSAARREAAGEPRASRESARAAGLSLG